MLNNSVSSSVESTQNEVRNKCLDCGAQYKTQQTLKRHRGKQHGAGYEKDTRHKSMIEECGLKFMQVKSLTEHMVSHRNMDIGMLYFHPIFMSEIMPYGCICTIHRNTGS